MSAASSGCAKPHLGAHVFCEDRAPNRTEKRLVVELKQTASVRDLLGVLQDVRQVEVEDERDRRVVTLELTDQVDEEVVSQLADREEVVAVRWRR